MTVLSSVSAGSGSDCSATELPVLWRFASPSVSGLCSLPLGILNTSVIIMNLCLKSLLIQIYFFEVNFFDFTGGSYFDVQT